jgi:hypothetical protein
MARAKTGLRAGVSQPAMQALQPLKPMRQADIVELPVAQEEFEALIQGFVAERYKPVPEGKVRSVDIAFDGAGSRVILTVSDADPPIVPVEAAG